MTDDQAAEIAALPSMQALPLKRRFFAMRYVNTQNGADACRQAGYKENPRHDQQISVTARRLLGDAAVALAVREGLAVKWRALAIGADEVIARASRIARHDHRKLLHAAQASTMLESLDDDTAEALQGVRVRREVDKHGALKAETIEYRVASKLGALELLARYHRLLSVDATVADFGLSFADAMERAGRRAVLRDQAAGAPDAIVSDAGQADTSGAASAAAEDFARGHGT